VNTLESQKKAIAIACRLDSQRALDITKEISDFLMEKGEKIFFENRIASKFISHFRKEINSMYGGPNGNTKFIISVGGDGTVLRIAQNISDKNPPPIFGINMGSVGFLDESSVETVKDDLTRILAGDYTIEEVPRLYTMINGQHLPLSLNEVLILSSKPSKVLHVKISIDSAHFTSAYLDGVIVASTTGSTGYALSAGGCLVDPRVQAVEIVPVNPFAGTGLIKPLFVPATSTIEIELLRPRLNGLLVIDGQTEYRIAPLQKITIKQAHSHIKFIRLNKKIHEGFYHRLKHKILYSKSLEDTGPEE